MSERPKRNKNQAKSHHDNSAHFLSTAHINLRFSAYQKLYKEKLVGKLIPVVVLAPRLPPGRQKLQKHTAASIRWWSPTQLLIGRSETCLWQSGRDADYSSVYGRM